MEELFYALAALSLISSITAFILYGIDKRRAETGKWRIREIVLILFAVFGGALGAVLGMFAFRHKTKRWYFYLANFGALAASAAVLGFLYFTTF